MSSRTVTLSAAVVTALLVTRATTAHADEATAAKPYEHVVASFEGLGALNERYGASLELVLSPRDSLTLYPWTAGGASTGPHGVFDGFFEGNYKTYAVQTRAQGIDLQYRHYVALSPATSRGARGIFYAPGFEAASYVTNGFGCDHTYDSDNSSSKTACGSSSRQAFTYVAPSLDIGGQTILPLGITLGASVGAHYRIVADGDLDGSVMPVGWSIAHGAGFRPRLRAWIGFAFL